MDTIRIRTTQNVDIEYEVAGLGERILARLIDFGIFMAAFFVLMIISEFLKGSIGNLLGDVTAIILGLVTFVFYDLITELTMNGQSIGKRVMKIRVISLDGSRPKFGQFLLRWVMRIVDFSLTSWLAATISVAVSEKKQRLGDMVAGTTLIKTQPRAQAAEFNDIEIQNDYVPTFPEVSRLSDRDVNLIFEVMQAYRANGNVDLITTLSQKLRTKLEIHSDMDDFSFLQTILKDYQSRASIAGY
ncbi:MAG: RDD family protein [Mucilaginibacter polytrichastri]|nr:RDD family protein [Mucilaginibacter polytrichastri]